MPAFTISILTFLLLLSGPCSTTRPAVQKGPWSLELKTSGGFVGVGRGNIAIDSEGKCRFVEATGPRSTGGVTGTLYARQLQPISEAVARLDPKGWSKPGLNVAAPDAFHYRLEYRSGPEKKDIATVEWYDNTADQLPADLKRLSTLLEQAMKHPCDGPP